MADVTKSSQPGKSYKEYLTDLEKLFEEYLHKKAPALPEGVKEAIVRFGPWITLIMMILAAPVLLAALGIGTFLSPFAFMGGINAGFGYMAGLLFSVVVIVLELIALPGLFKREMKSWRLMYYVTLLNAVHNAISLNISGLVIGTLLSMYILFQVREYYK
ncbi:chromate transporter [Candidatus Roizmanbacteria bacterium CG_4_10_14_0_8_um_filter_33_9]|uniref:Chromate transporter n=1 Tax=Candidatus Roizmanbacteria bacterium CG_4_10_14_0_8_um_filter_33_9 TaxID=1974826 RepID=A0A2M7QJN2_9BACT|nr:MAG: chromate transporter [Candidatus Roizmanbacteria bacterium CG_4_10_14_0_8_um_filter_33_9]